LVDTRMSGPDDSARLRPGAEGADHKAGRCIKPEQFQGAKDMAKTLALGLVLGVLFPWAAAVAADGKKADADPGKGVEIKAKELEDKVLKGDGFVANNLSLSESTDGQPKGMALLKIAATCKNKSKEAHSYVVMMVGLDDDKGIRWATKLTSEGEVDPNLPGLLRTRSRCPPAR